MAKKHIESLPRCQAVSQQLYSYRLYSYRQGTLSQYRLSFEVSPRTVLLDHKFKYSLGRPYPSTRSGLKAIEGACPEAPRRVEGRTCDCVSKDYEAGACIVPSFIIASTELNILISSEIDSVYLPSQR